MRTNVIKVVHRWSFEAGKQGDAIRGEPGFIDLIERILDKGLVLDAADRMRLSSGCRARVLLDHLGPERT